MSASKHLDKNSVDVAENRLPYYPPIRFHLNRYILLVILFIYTLFVGPNFFNWFSWETVFRETGTYGHLCDGSSPAKSPASSPDAPFCNDRKQATDRLFLIVQAFTFCFSFIAGLLLDIIGAKASCALGNVLLMLGWIAIMFSSNRGELLPLGFALIGTGTDASFFGNLSFSNVFPENPSLIISLLGAARSVSNFLPKGFASLSRNYPNVFNMRGIAAVFIIAYAICFIVSIILIPTVPYHAVTESSDDSPKETQLSELTSRSKDDASFGQNQNSQDRRPGWTQASLTSEPSPNIFKRLARDIMFPIKLLKSSIYLPIVIYCIVNILRNGYYTVSAKDRLGDAFSLLEVMILLAFIPGPICGYLVNQFGPFPVMHVLNFCIGIVFICVFLAGVVTNAAVSTVLNYISACFALPFMGFILSQVYCYIAIVFDDKDLGKLVGFSSFIAGVFGLLTEIFTSVARSVGFIYVDLFNILISIGSGFLLTYAARKVKKYKENQTLQVSSLVEP